MKIFLPVPMFRMAQALGYSQGEQRVAARDPVENPVSAASIFSQEYLAPIPILTFH